MHDASKFFLVMNFYVAIQIFLPLTFMLQKIIFIDQVMLELTTKVRDISFLYVFLDNHVIGIAETRK